MPVTFAKGLARRLHRSSGGFYVQVQCGPGDEAQARIALDAATDDIWAIPHEDEPGGSAAKYVDLIEIPTGPMLYIDMADAPIRSIQAAVDAVVARVGGAGIDAVVATLSERGLQAQEYAHFMRHDGLGLTPGPALIVERAEPLQKGQLPDSWADAATEWLLTDEPSEAWLRVGVEFRILGSELRRWLQRMPSSVYGASTGSVKRGIRKLDVLSGHGMKLASVGRDQESMAQEVDELKHLARSLVPRHDYAAIDVAASTSGNGDDPRYADRWEDAAFLADFRRNLWPFSLGGMHILSSVGRPRPWHWQSFSSAYVDSLTGMPRGATSTPEGGVEFVLGSLDEWASRAPTLPRVIEGAFRVFDQFPSRS